MKGLTDVSGVLVGHASDETGHTGCTAILCPGGAIAGGDIRGSATGTSEFDVLNPLHVATKIHGICFAGGSAFGLEAACGVRRWLAGKSVGFETKYGKVPLVPSAILFDLGLAKPGVYPGREMGEAAAAAAGDGPVAEGCVGAGTGATVGKALGLSHAMKGGVGSFSVRSGRVVVAALAAVNSFGDVIHPRNGTIIAGARVRQDSREFADSTNVLRGGAHAGSSFTNTTLVAVATNALLTKDQATRLAQVSQQGLVRAISPVHTPVDGDLAIALSTGNESAEFGSLGVLAADVVAESIQRAVMSAWTVDGIPGLSPVPVRTNK